MLGLLSENPIVHRAMSLEKRKHQPGFVSFIKRRYVGMLVWFLPLLIFFFEMSDPAKWDCPSLAAASRSCLQTAGLFSLLCFAIRAVQSTSSSITQEREQRTFESMTSTLLGPSEVVVGKLWVAVAPLIRESFEWLPLALLLGFFGHMTLAVAQLQLLTLTIIGFSALVGMLFSYWARSSQDAGRLAGVSVFAWLLVLPTLGSMAVSLTATCQGLEASSPQPIDLVAVLSPLTCWTRGASVPNTSIALGFYVAISFAAFAHLVYQQRRAMTERTR